ncbi:hypothetical protein DPEC_G00245480 [Dallia pectoralis]|uniref:Uncharacterized protein n=1 Tax=Dallia pectoralis TaxID=75939 RepID=A0ACC2FWA2_DALPE|nr:hypothetical protein DPEC_G00245480 [Dallia pectoralis]
MKVRRSCSAHQAASVLFLSSHLWPQPSALHCFCLQAARDQSPERLCPTITRELGRVSANGKVWLRNGFRENNERKLRACLPQKTLAGPAWVAHKTREVEHLRC